MNTTNSTTICPGCGRDCSRVALVDLLHTFEPAGDILVETTWHKGCFVANSVKWIPVAERLPELTQVVKEGVGFSDPVLIWSEDWSEDGVMDVATYHYSDDPDSSGWLTNDAVSEKDGWNVTHWQPSPAGPKDK